MFFTLKIQLYITLIKIWVSYRFQKFNYVHFLSEMCFFFVFSKVHRETKPFAFICSENDMEIICVSAQFCFATDMLINFFLADINFHLFDMVTLCKLVSVILHSNFSF